MATNYLEFKTRYILHGRTHEFACDHGIRDMVFYHEVYGQHTFKKSKDKAVPGKRSFEYLYGKVPVCLPLTLLPRTLLWHCFSSKAFFLTSLGKRFELIQIFKALCLTVINSITENRLR